MLRDRYGLRPRPIVRQPAASSPPAAPRAAPPDLTAAVPEAVGAVPFASPIAEAPIAAAPLEAPPDARAQAARAARGRLGRNITVLLSSQVVIWAVTFVANVFVPRGLGPTRMGELTVAQSIGTILDTIFALGYGTLMIKEIARDHSRAAGLIGSALWTRVALLVPGCAVVFALTRFIHGDGELSTLIWIAWLGTFIGMMVGPFTAAFQGLEQMQYTAMGNVLSRSVISLVSILLVWFGSGPAGLLGLSAFISLVILGLSWWWSRPMLTIDWTWDLSRVRFLMVGSLPYWTTALVLSFYMWIDSLMLSVLAPIQVVGWYSVPVKLFAALLFVPVILGTAYLPRLSRAQLDGREALSRQARRLIELAVTASLPVAAGLVLVSWELVKVLYGNAFLPSSPILVILAIGLPATYVNIVANQILIASNRQVRWTVVMIVAAIANPLINLFLIRYAQSSWGNGGEGAAIALLITEVGMAITGLVLIRDTLRWSVLGRLVRAAGGTLAMSATVWLLSHRFGLTVMIAGGGITFVAGSLALGVLSDDELQQVWAVVQRVQARVLPRRLRFG